MRTTTSGLPDGARIVQRTSRSAKTWVVLGPVSDEQRATGDLTQPEVSAHYVTKSALLAALAAGKALL